MTIRNVVSKTERLDDPFVTKEIDFDLTTRRTHLFHIGKRKASQKATLLPISLAGPINRSNAATLDKLIEEVAQKSPGWVIINVRDIARNIERTRYAAFAKLQKLIREKPAELKICSLHPDLKAAFQFHARDSL